MVTLAKEALKVSEINHASILGKMIKFMYESRCFIFEIDEESQDKVEAIVKTCPLRSYSLKMVDKTSDDAYHKSLGDIDKAQVEEFLKTVGIEKIFEASWEKLICLGDQECRFVIRKKA